MSNPKTSLEATVTANQAIKFIELSRKRGYEWKFTRYVALGQDDLKKMLGVLLNTHFPDTFCATLGSWQLSHPTERTLHQVQGDIPLVKVSWNDDAIPNFPFDVANAYNNSVVLARYTKNGEKRQHSERSFRCATLYSETWNSANVSDTYHISVPELATWRKFLELAESEAAGNFDYCQRARSGELRHEFRVRRRQRISSEKDLIIADARKIEQEMIGTYLQIKEGKISI